MIVMHFFSIVSYTINIPKNVALNSTSEVDSALYIPTIANLSLLLNQFHRKALKQFINSS